MKRKIIVIFIAIFLLILHIVLNLKYNSKITAIKINENYTNETFINKYANNYMKMLQNQEYKEAYELYIGNNYKTLDEFKEYFSKKIIGPNNLFIIESIKLEDRKYEVIVQVCSPLYSTYEDKKLEINSEKKLKLMVTLNGIYDYKINEIIKVEE